MKQLFTADKKLYWLLGAVGIVLAAAIVMVSLLLIGGTPSGDSASTGGSDVESHGSTTQYIGGVSSYRNLKGLTLRLNQVETCNPSVVSAYVAVSSDEGIVNKNFSKKDVKIYLDGKQITDFDFTAVDTTKLPLANMLVIDRSGSMQGVPIDNAKQAVSSYVDKLKTSDQVGLVEFDNQIDLLAAMTTDKVKVKNAISSITARGDTATYDAMATAIDQVPDCGRKAVTILTDGDDNSSKNNTEASIITKANTENLPIFSVGIKGSTFNPASIKNISDKTGGMYLEANTPQEISDLYGKIDGQLSGQFAANLKLSLKKDGSTHTLKIVSTVEGSDTGSERSFVY